MLRTGFYLRLGVICAVLLAGGCDVSMAEGQFRCASDSDCPNGWLCNLNGDAHCYSPEVMADSGMGNTDTNTTADTSTAADSVTAETGSEGDIDTTTVSDQGNDTSTDTETASVDANDTQTGSEADSNTELDSGSDTITSTGNDFPTDSHDGDDTDTGMDSEDTSEDTDVGTDTETTESTDDDSDDDTAEDTGEDTEADSEDDTGEDTEDDTGEDTVDDTGEDTDDDTDEDTGEDTGEDTDPINNSCSVPILITQSDNTWSGDWTALTATFSQNNPTGCGEGITDAWFRVSVPGKGSVSIAETTAAEVVIREVDGCGINSCDGYSDGAEQYMLSNNANVPRSYYIVVSESPSNAEDMFTVTFSY